MNRTKIEWVKNPDGTQGYTWNPITGCLNGCPYCYARKLANGRLRSMYLANKNTMDDDVIMRQLDPFYPRFWKERFENDIYNLASAKPRGIFVCDMSDLFGIGIPEEWTRLIMEAIENLPQHRFYLLTKQYQNLIKWSPFPDNCWVGVSATDFKMFVDALAHLTSIKASVKYISFEPLLSWDKVITNKFAYSDKLGHAFEIDQLLREAGIRWVIIGAQTRPYKPPKIEWVAEIVQACDKAHIPVFLKDNLKPSIPVPFINQMWGKDKLRQEMPNANR